VYFTSSGKKKKNQTQTQLAQKEILDKKSAKMNDKSQESKEPA
jgi:hypothetical protein